MKCNRFGEEMVVKSEGLFSERSFALEMEMRDHLAIGQGLQQQLLRKFFFFCDRRRRNRKQENKKKAKKETRYRVRLMPLEIRTTSDSEGFAVPAMLTAAAEVVALP